MCVCVFFYLTYFKLCDVPKGIFCAEFNATCSRVIALIVNWWLIEW